MFTLSTGPMLADEFRRLGMTLHGHRWKAAVARDCELCYRTLKRHDSNGEASYADRLTSIASRLGYHRKDNKLYTENEGGIMPNFQIIGAATGGVIGAIFTHYAFDWEPSTAMIIGGFGGLLCLALVGKLIDDKIAEEINARVRYERALDKERERD